MQGAAGRFELLARLGARGGHFGLGPSRSHFFWLKAGGSLKGPPGCTDFGRDAEISGRRVPRATAVREALKMASARAAGRFAFLARPGARVGQFGLGPPLGRDLWLKADGSMKTPSQSGIIDARGVSSQSRVVATIRRDRLHP